MSQSSAASSRVSIAGGMGLEVYKDRKGDEMKLIKGMGERIMRASLISEEEKEKYE